MNQKILFVDDDPFVLQGLQRLLHKHRNEWNMEFVESGSEALELLKQQPFEIICSDMRMPEMDGATLLNNIRENYPQMIRIILSGQSAEETIFKVLGPAHQYLTKPCDAERLLYTVKKCIQVSSRIDNELVRQTIGKTNELPSLPAIVFDLIMMMQDPDSSVQDIGTTIEKDIALSAKVLQIANSSFFGLDKTILTPKHAATIIGKNLLKPVVLSASVFSQFNSANPAIDFDFEEFTNRCLCTGRVAEKMVNLLTDDQDIFDQALIAGLLHDVGLLLSLDQLADNTEQLLLQAKSEKLPLWQPEQSHYGVTHAEIGAHLLGLWGFPYSIVEAVAFHNQPQLANECSELIKAVHIASVWAERFFQSPECLHSTYQEDFIEPDELEFYLTEIDNEFASEQDSTSPAAKT